MSGIDLRRIETIRIPLSGAIFSDYYATIDDEDGLVVGINQKMLGEIVIGRIMPLLPKNKDGTNVISILLYDGTKVSGLELSKAAEHYKATTALNVSFEVRKRLYDSEMVTYSLVTPVKIFQFEFVELAVCLATTQEEVMLTVQNWRTKAVEGLQLSLDELNETATQWDV